AFGGGKLRDINTSFTQSLCPATGLRVGITVQVINLLDPRLNECLRARTSAPGVPTRLECHHCGGAIGASDCLGQCLYFRVCATGWLSRAGAYYLAGGRDHD